MTAAADPPTPEALSRFLQEHAELTPPLRLDRIGAGQSNLTYLVADADRREWVLRCPPPGDHDGTAHDVRREARVLRALAGTPVPVPAVVATGTDVAGVAAAFCVMQRAPGQVLTEEADAARLAPADRARLGGEVLAVLAELHAVDPDAVGLGDLGPREGYVARQVRRTARNWAAWGSDASAAATWEECRCRLEGRVPPQQRAVVAHGDYRLANLLVSGTVVTAVLDWELCTLGDPLADLAWLVDDWRSPDDPAITIPSPTRAGGFPDRDALVADYAARTGLDVTPLGWYRAFTHWKAATLLQGVLVRRRSGGLGSHGALDLRDLERTISFLLEEALDLV